MSKKIQKSFTRAPFVSLSEFFQRFETYESPEDMVDVYRGHGDSDYKLVPGLFRTSAHRKDEKNISRELLSLHPGEFNTDRSVFDQLVRMQHHSMETRLLDVTFNPLVALYFACAGEREAGADGQFIRLSVKKTRLKYFDSDTVSCVANLSNLTGDERGELRRIREVEDLRDSASGKRLLQFIKAEKPYFLPEIIPGDLRKILVVKPKQSNRRILAQQGAFLLYGLTSELLDGNRFGIQIRRTVVPAESKASLLRQLDRININEASLFPEIEKAARYIMGRLTPVSGGEQL